MVARAASGAAAIALARKLRPELALIGIVLEEPVDGIELAAAIKAALDIPHIFISAVAHPDTLARAARTDPLGHLGKPYDPQKLALLLKQARPRDPMESGEPRTCGTRRGS